MNALACTLTLAVSAAAARPLVAAPAKAEARLVGLVEEVRSADYRGDRAELRRLVGALDGITARGRVAAVRYWQGFALWRRALNGFNETPWPDDLKGDLQAAVARFRAALAARPDWIEAKIGMVGASASLLYLAGDDAAQTKPILAEFLPLARELADKGADNPRALWLTAGFQLYRGDAVKAAATMRKGLEAAESESRRRPVPPAYEPTWGGAENLMNLAYLYSQGASRDRGVALAYAEGALVAAPEWHYVRDVLMAQIRALEEAPAPAASPAAEVR